MPDSGVPRDERLSPHRKRDESDGSLRFRWSGQGFSLREDFDLG